MRLWRGKRHRMVDPSAITLAELAPYELAAAASVARTGGASGTVTGSLG